MFEQEILDFLTSSLEGYDESHDITHAYAVLENARKIMRTYSDEFRDSCGETIELAALLHDTVDHKYPNADLKRKKLELILNDKYPHLAEDVLFIIDNISFSKEKKFGYPQGMTEKMKHMRDIVSDADKLEAIGEIGYMRCYQFGKAIAPELSDDLIRQRVVDHFHDKLSLLATQYIHTIAGKEMAAPLHAELERMIYN